MSMSSMFDTKVRTKHRGKQKHDQRDELADVFLDEAHNQARLAFRNFPI